MKVGIVGFGRLGKYLYSEILRIEEPNNIQVSFIWNRSKDVFNESGLPGSLILNNLEDFTEREASLIIEVCHPQIVKEYGEKFLKHCDFMVGSPTALADEKVERQMKSAAIEHDTRLFIATGAFWGASDIRKMDDSNNLESFQITMTKHPDSFKVHGSVLENLQKAKEDNESKHVLYSGPVRDLCKLAPNNVNTMAVACFSAPSLGFDKIIGKLVSDKNTNSHTVRIEAYGKIGEDGNRLSVITERVNPARSGAVTGNETFKSFMYSLKVGNELFDMDSDEIPMVEDDDVVEASGENIPEIRVRKGSENRSLAELQDTSLAPLASFETLTDVESEIDPRSPDRESLEENGTSTPTANSTPDTPTPHEDEPVVNYEQFEQEDAEDKEGESFPPPPPPEMILTSPDGTSTPAEPEQAGEEEREYEDIPELPEEEYAQEIAADNEADYANGAQSDSVADNIDYSQENYVEETEEFRLPENFVPSDPLAAWEEAEQVAKGTYYQPSAPAPVTATVAAPVPDPAPAPGPETSIVQEAEYKPERPEKPPKPQPPTKPPARPAAPPSRPAAPPAKPPPPSVSAPKKPEIPPHRPSQPPVEKKKRGISPKRFVRSLVETPEKREKREKKKLEKKEKKEKAKEALSKFLGLNKGAQPLRSEEVTESLEQSNESWKQFDEMQERISAVVDKAKLSQPSVDEEEESLEREPEEEFEQKAAPPPPRPAPPRPPFNSPQTQHITPAASAENQTCDVDDSLVNPVKPVLPDEPVLDLDLKVCDSSPEDSEDFKAMEPVADKEEDDDFDIRDESAVVEDVKPADDKGFDAFGSEESPQNSEFVAQFDDFNQESTQKANPTGLPIEPQFNLSMQVAAPVGSTQQTFSPTNSTPNEGGTTKPEEYSSPKDERAKEIVSPTISTPKDFTSKECSSVASTPKEPMAADISPKKPEAPSVLFDLSLQPLEPTLATFEPLEQVADAIDKLSKKVVENQKDPYLADFDPTFSGNTNMQQVSSKPDDIFEKINKIAQRRRSESTESIDSAVLPVRTGSTKRDPFSTIDVFSKEKRKKSLSEMQFEKRQSLSECSSPISWEKPVVPIPAYVDPKLQDPFEFAPEVESKPELDQEVRAEVTPKTKHPETVEKAKSEEPQPQIKEIKERKTDFDFQSAKLDFDDDVFKDAAVPVEDAGDPWGDADEVAEGEGAFEDEAFECFTEEAKPSKAQSKVPFDPFRTISEDGDDPVSFSSVAIKATYETKKKEEREIEAEDDGEDEEKNLKVNISAKIEVKEDKGAKVVPLLPPPPKVVKEPTPPTSSDEEEPEEDYQTETNLSMAAPVIAVSSPDGTTAENNLVELQKVFEPEVLEPLPPFYEPFKGTGWKMMIRMPLKKKLTGNRYWKNCFVRLQRVKDVPTICIYDNETASKPFHELGLQPSYQLCNLGLQAFDEFGKCHTIKIQYIFYRERVGMHADRIAPTIGDIVRVKDLKGLKDIVHRPKKTMLLDHHPQSSELVKLGSLDYEGMKTFIREVEDTMMSLKPVKPSAQAQPYTKDEITIDVVDEYYCELDQEHRILYHKARIRVFCLAFLSGNPSCELGMNDITRQGKEVVGRHDIIPIKTEEWITIEQTELHQLIDAEGYKRDTVFRFKPMDAIRFELFRFRTRPRVNKELPLQIRMFVDIKEKCVEWRCEIMVSQFWTMSRKASQTPCKDICIRIPIPESWVYIFRVEKRKWNLHQSMGSVHSTKRRAGKIKGLERLTQLANSVLPPSLIEVTCGQAKYENLFKALVWRVDQLPRFNEGAYKQHELRCRIDLQSHDVIPESYDEYCWVEYNQPKSCVSRAQVRSISVENPDNTDRWVHHTANYEYKVQMCMTKSANATGMVQKLGLIDQQLATGTGTDDDTQDEDDKESEKDSEVVEEESKESKEIEEQQGGQVANLLDI
ncbi:DgyrCDS7431 [Dimorphilus gyrociliatus]|uniref:Aspartate dehydrogenase domain-containing protein n=1 Tax=Dimorphilus gyrociliatus TaxID=2664684 RepID=A0A7I8VT89_9ANNE|nr:DgyrCDS7431 [Dimorphilus gyrociliatus]